MFSARDKQSKDGQDSASMSKRSRSRIVQKPLGSEANLQKIVEGRAETGSTHNFDQASENHVKKQIHKIKIEKIGQS